MDWLGLNNPEKITKLRCFGKELDIKNVIGIFVCCFSIKRSGKQITDSKNY